MNGKEQIGTQVEIPEAAMPVVLILRRDVPRPTAEIVQGPGGAPRFVCGKCPMGLHPTALYLTPSTPNVFTPNSPLGGLNEVRWGTDGYSPGYVFWNWWDYLTLDEAREAVDLIWPEATQPAPQATSTEAK